MILLDSNIIIYSAAPEFEYLRDLFIPPHPYVSAITIVEALGYRNLAMEDKKYLESLFLSLSIIPIDKRVIDKAVLLRQENRIALGDAIIASTALVHGLTLYTRNTADFTKISGLQLYNPLK